MLNADFEDFFHQIKTDRIFGTFQTDPFRYNTPLLQDLRTWITTEKTAKLFLLKCSEEQFKSMIILGETGCDIDFIIGPKNSIFI